MPEYLSPGVYVEEVEIGGKPIEGVSTSTAGFLGEAERGPVQPRLITGFAQYQRLYGGHAWKAADGKPSDSYLPYAVEGFFTNGGKRCYVGRVTAKGCATMKAVIGQKDKPNITVSALGPGAWGKRVGVGIAKASQAKKEDTSVFKLVIGYWTEDPGGLSVDERGNMKGKNERPPTVFEEFDNLSWDPNSTEYFERRLHGQSQLVEVGAGGDAPEAEAPAAPAAGGNAPPPAPAARRGREASGSALLSAAGDLKDTKPTTDDYKGDEDTPCGLAALKEKDDISILSVPNAAEIPGLTNEVVAHCELLKDRIAVLTGKKDAAAIGDLFPSAEGADNINSKYAAFYYPWIKVIDPVTNVPKLIPPPGHVAGVYARSDIERGVHKAPANEVLRGVVDLQFNVNKGDQEMLNPRGVNCIRSFVGRGIMIWGARTTSKDPLWKYVNVRRLFIFMEKSIERSTQWVVFEPNNEHLWARVRQSVSDFLTQVWKDGALMGLTPEEAFFVRCDKTTMTDNDIENGRLIVVIGVAPARPAEFVIFRLAQWRSGSSITE